jgi:hypothetical protein
MAALFIVNTQLAKSNDITPSGIDLSDSSSSLPCLSNLCSVSFSVCFLLYIEVLIE